MLPGMLIVPPGPFIIIVDPWIPEPPGIEVGFPRMLKPPGKLPFSLVPAFPIAPQCPKPYPAELLIQESSPSSLRSFI
jgi:hypothetical protein